MHHAIINGLHEFEGRTDKNKKNMVIFYPDYCNIAI